MPVYAGSTLVSKIYHGSTLLAGGYAAVSQFFGGTAQPPLASACMDDPFWEQVSLLLPLDGANGSTSFTDYSSNGFPLTSANAEISTEQSKFGGASVKILSASGYLSLAAQSEFAWGTGDFTLEFWIRGTNFETSNPNIFDTRPSAQNLSNRFALYMWARQLRWYANGADRIGSTISLSDNVWYHLAFTRQSGTSRMFVNGVLQGSFADTHDYGVSRGPIIGNGWNLNNTGMTGFIDDLRITKGVARYPADFTPSTAAFPTTNVDPYFSDVVLLLQDSLADESPQGQTVTAAGNAAISTSVVKVGTHSLATPSVNDYFLIAGDPSLDFGTGDFTVECWLYMTGGSGNRNFIDFRGRTGATISGRLVIRRSTAGLSVWDGDFRISASAPVPDNQWLHIACTRQSGHLRLFLNGSLYGENASHTTALVCDNIALGGTNSSFGMTGYFDGIRITKGAARYTADFTPSTSPHPTPVDPLWQSVKLLLPFDGPTIVDYSSQELAVTTSGTVALDYDTKLFGQASLSSETSTGSFPTHYISVPGATLGIGTADFTIEARVLRTGDLTQHVRFLYPANHVFAGNRLQFLIFRETSSTGRLYSDVYGSVLVQSGVLTWEQGRWYHVALTRTGGTIKLWRDGVEVASNANATNLNSDTAYRISPGNANARIDDLRMTIGVARYTQQFTPSPCPHPTAIDPYCDQVAILLPMDGAVGSGSFADESSNLHTISTFGNAQITATAKYGQAGYFDGSGDYLDASGPSLAAGTGPFTIESWMRLASYPATNAYRGIAGTMTTLTSASASAWHFSIVNLSGTLWLNLGRHSTPAYARTPFSPSLNQWYHVAACRDDAGNIYLFINGESQTVTTSGAAVWAAADFTTQLFSAGVVATPHYWHGELDDLRFTVGVCRYREDFNLGSLPHPICPYTS